MLTYISNEGKTYTERFNEALTQIPLYTDDWTNFNPSDPGITILETLTGFETLQQERLLDTSNKVRTNLLKMVGFKIKKGRGARLLLAADDVQKRTSLPPNHSFRIGSLTYETNRRLEIDDFHLVGIYGYKEDTGEFSDYSSLLDQETTVPIRIFGNQPRENDALYLVANKLPDSGRETIFYFTLQERYNRNPISERMENTFAAVEWECYTQDGWESIDVRDNTNAFLMSGEVKLWIPEGAVPFDGVPVEGYCIRASLGRAEYDVVPKVTVINAFLFEVWQKHTLSENHTFGKSKEVEVYSGIEEETYINVFCRESKGESYRKYQYSPDPEREGRFYDRRDIGPGRCIISFDKLKRGFGPERGRNCVRVVLYTEDVMRHFNVGRVLGYDNQRLEIPYQRLVAHTFTIIARRINDEGDEIFDFVRPEKDGDGALYYHLLESDGVIEIEDAGEFIGADLFLASICVHEGADGNIRSGNVLSSSDDSGAVYYNPGPGTGGEFRERIEDVRKRFVKDMEASYTAVTERDYEELVKSTPGLCIHKAKAYMNEEKNLVSIAVKPGTDETYPRLSSIYTKMIRDRIEERRLLTTRIDLVQPVYTAVNVSGSVYVKLHYEYSLEDITETIRRHIDYLNTDRNFGDRLRFDEVFHAIEMLECVEYVYDLSLRPQSQAVARIEDSDIIPNINCLLYPGQIDIETISFEE